MTASIGAVTYRQAPTEMDTFVSDADATMYKVKYETKNGILIEER